MGSWKLIEIRLEAKFPGAGGGARDFNSLEYKVRRRSYYCRPTVRETEGRGRGKTLGEVGGCVPRCANHTS